MNYKCRFCGYRFKDKDEQICPECFTAREEDITCGAFSEDDHSHYFSVSDMEREESFFSKNETFKEERNEFLDDERRNESRTAAARYEKLGQKQYNRQNNTQQQTNIPAQSGSAMPKQNVYSRRPYDPNKPVSITNYNLNTPPQQTPKNNSGCSCGCVVFIIIISIIIGVAENIAENIGLEKSKETTSAAASSVEVHNEPSKSDTGEFEFPAQTAADYSYYVKVSDFTTTKTGVFELSDTECERFMIIDSSVGSKHYNNDMALELVRTDFTVELYKAEPDKNFNKVEYVLTFSKEKDKDTFYEYYIPQNDDSLIIESYVSGSDGETASQRVRGSVIHKPDTENIEFVVGVSDGIDSEEFVFNIN